MDSTYTSPSSSRHLDKNFGLIVNRQIDKYDGQRIYINNQVVFELGNYLGGGASGCVYQANEVFTNREVAMKILNPIGFKTSPSAVITKCTVVSKGMPLQVEQISGKSPMLKENVWWLYNHNMKQAVAAFEDPHRGRQIREMTLTKCVEVWGFNPFGDVSPEEADKLNIRSEADCVNGIAIFLPIVPQIYLKWLKSRQSICREMSNMLLIGEHPNIIDLFEVLELVQDTKTTLFLVLEVAGGGMLFDRIKYNYSLSSEVFAKKYFTQLISGIAYCHGKGVVHRDLKPENLLLSDLSESAILKIADFGFSAVIFASEISHAEDFPNHSLSNSHHRPPDPPNRDSCSDTNNTPVRENSDEVTQLQRIRGSALLAAGSGFNTPLHPGVTDAHVDSSPPYPVTLRRLRSVVGSPHYIAPEISNDDPSGYDGRKVDMWSAGVILYCLLTGNLPFSTDLKACNRFKRYRQWLNSECSTMVKEGKTVIFPTWFCSTALSPLSSSLLVSLLHPDPSSRLSAAQVLRHPWCLGDSASELHALSSIDISDSSSSSSSSSVAIGSASSEAVSASLNSSSAGLLLRNPNACTPLHSPSKNKPTSGYPTANSNGSSNGSNHTSTKCPSPKASASNLAGLTASSAAPLSSSNSGNSSSGNNNGNCSDDSKEDNPNKTSRSATQRQSDGRNRSPNSDDEARHKQGLGPS